MILLSVPRLSEQHCARDVLSKIKWITYTLTTIKEISWDAPHRKYHINLPSSLLTKVSFMKYEYVPKKEKEKQYIFFVIKHNKDCFA